MIQIFFKPFYGLRMTENGEKSKKIYLFYIEEKIFILLFRHNYCKITTQVENISFSYKN